MILSLPPWGLGPVESALLFLLISGIGIRFQCFLGGYLGKYFSLWLPSLLLTTVLQDKQLSGFFYLSQRRMTSKIREVLLEYFLRFAISGSKSLFSCLRQMKCIHGINFCGWQSLYKYGFLSFILSI